MNSTFPALQANIPLGYAHSCYQC